MKKVWILSLIAAIIIGCSNDKEANQSQPISDSSVSELQDIESKTDETKIYEVAIKFIYDELSIMELFRQEDWTQFESKYSFKEFVYSHYKDKFISAPDVKVVLVDDEHELTETTWDFIVFFRCFKQSPSSLLVCYTIFKKEGIKKHNVLGEYPVIGLPDIKFGLLKTADEVPTFLTLNVMLLEALLEYDRKLKSISKQLRQSK